jgi:DNA-binding MarR family transcriptional regulator
VTRGSKASGSKAPRSKTGVAKEVWTELLGYFFAHRDTTFGAVAKLGLTPGDMKTLFELDPDDGCSMSALANTLHCDASNATWLIDRLEERGLVERRPHPGDRRVKTVVLTTEGVATKKLLIDQLSEPPADLLALDRTALDQLAAALALLPEHPPFWEPAPRKTVPDAG